MIGREGGREGDREGGTEGGYRQDRTHKACEKGEEGKPPQFLTAFHRRDKGRPSG